MTQIKYTGDSPVCPKGFRTMAVVTEGIAIFMCGGYRIVTPYFKKIS